MAETDAHSIARQSPTKPGLNNHIAMTILYHEEPTTAEPATKDGTTRPALGIRVVGFEVKAYRFPPLLFVIELG